MGDQIQANKEISAFKQSNFVIIIINKMYYLSISIVKKM